MVHAQGNRRIHHNVQLDPHNAPDEDAFEPNLSKTIVATLLLFEGVNPPNKSHATIIVFDSFDPKRDFY